MIRTIAISSTVLAGLALAACETTPPSPLAAASDRCAGVAYEAVFGGTNAYSAEDRTILTQILRGEEDPAGTISASGERRILNTLEAGAASAFFAQYRPCMEDATEAM